MKANAFISATLLLVPAPAGAQDQSMSFFVTSENAGQGADLGGLEGADVTLHPVCRGRGRHRQDVARLPLDQRGGCP